MSRLDVTEKIIATKVAKGLKWADVARRYNGPAYKENRYDTKLAEAYDHFTKVYPVKEVADASA